MASGGSDMPKCFCPSGDCKCGEACTCTPGNIAPGCCCQAAAKSVAKDAVPEKCPCLCEGCKAGSHCGGECKEGTCGGKCLCTAVKC